MKRRGRKIPEDEEREARDQAVSIYLTKSEIDDLEKYSRRLGFRSKSALVVSVMAPLIQGGFSGFSFLKIGNQFASLIGKLKPGEYEYIGILKFLTPRKRKEIEEGVEGGAHESA